MIKHVVFLKFKQDVAAEKIGELEQGLGALPQSIEEIKEYVFGRDVVRSERSYDFALVSSFDDLEALKRDQVHPKHQEVLQLVLEICDSVLALDFEY